MNSMFLVGMGPATSVLEMEIGEEMEGRAGALAPMQATPSEVPLVTLVQGRLVHTYGGADGTDGVGQPFRQARQTCKCKCKCK